MIDVKKLITGFLILATAAVCSGLVLSFVNTSSTASATSAGSQIAIEGTNTPSDDTLAANAFVSSQQLQDVVDEAAPDLASSSMMVTSTDPSNLTDSLATQFVNGVVSANPDGPSGTDDSGNPTFTPPDVDSIAASIANSTATQNLEIPNWDIEAASIPVTVISTTSSSQVFAYGTAVNDVLNNHMNAQVQNIVNDEVDSASPTDLAYVQSQVQSALGDLSSLQTPSMAEGFQKSLISELVYEKNMLALDDLAQTDPVRANLIFQAEEEKFSSIQQNLLNQAQDVASESVSFQQTPAKSQGIVLSFIDSTFGISKANALLPVFDPASWSLIEANEAQLIGHQLETLLKNTLLQILKNTLVAIIQREVLTWVQGSGAPRFITNWGVQLINAYQATAINAINGLMSCGVYPSFIPAIKTTLGAYYKPGNNVCANQFSAALGSNSFQQFYNNFKNGGFIAFGASTLPSGNPYGGIFFNAQIVANTSQNASQAAAVKTTAQGGFQGNNKCDDGSDPANGQHLVCEGSPSSPNGDKDFPSPDGKTCPTGYTPDEYDNNGLCADGTQPVVTTPSAVTAFSLNSAIDATPKQIAAANSIAGVLNAVLSSLLTSLASTAVNAAGKLVNQGLTSLNGSSITAGATTPTPASAPLACNPTTQTIPAAAGTTNAVGSASTTTYPVTLSATGGTSDASGNPPNYSWIASNGATSTGGIFSAIFASAGSYTITLSDSAADTPVTCNIIVQ